ncbi:hypothetical protein [Kitasatospora sp. NPDC001225]
MDARHLGPASARAQRLEAEQEDVKREGEPLGIVHAGRIVGIRAVGDRLGVFIQLGGTGRPRNDRRRIGAVPVTGERWPCLRDGQRVVPDQAARTAFTPLVEPLTVC